MGPWEVNLNFDLFFWGGLLLEGEGRSLISSPSEEKESFSSKFIWELFALL